MEKRLLMIQKEMGRMYFFFKQNRQIQSTTARSSQQFERTDSVDCRMAVRDANEKGNGAFLEIRQTASCPLPPSQGL